MVAPNIVGREYADDITDTAIISERDSGEPARMNAMLSKMPRMRLTVSTTDAMNIPIRNAMCLTNDRIPITMVFIYFGEQRY